MKKRHKYIIHTIDELQDLAVRFLEIIPEKSIVCLDAEMGAGKTTFTQFVLQAMGIENPNGSPTYSIVNEYFSPIYGAVFHLDLYRIESEEELYDIGIEEILNSNSYVFIEWPSKAPNILPDGVVFLSIKQMDNGDRLFEF
jgi:tRNA threonylcarbamoyladenosine biosynthesis protein TsaE